MISIDGGSYYRQEIVNSAPYLAMIVELKTKEMVVGFMVVLVKYLLKDK